MAEKVVGVVGSPIFSNTAPHVEVTGNPPPPTTLSTKPAGSVTLAAPGTAPAGPFPDRVRPLEDHHADPTPRPAPPPQQQEELS